MNGEKYIGLTEEDAINSLKADGMKYRVKQRDNKNFMVTMDVQPNRANLYITDGKVTSVKFG